MCIVGAMVPALVVYRIDEPFADLTGIRLTSRPLGHIRSSDRGATST